MLNPTKTLEVIDALNKTVVVVLDGFRLFIHVKPNQIISALPAKQLQALID
jgi:hypothetical protein